MAASSCFASNDCQHSLSLISLFFVTGKHTKLSKLDESTIQDLAGDEDTAEQTKKKDLAAKQRKAQNKLQMRLAQEKKADKRKQAASKKEQEVEEMDDDDDAMLTFVKGSRDASKKKK